LASRSRSFRPQPELLALLTGIATYSACCAIMWSLRLERVQSHQLASTSNSCCVVPRHWRAPHARRRSAKCLSVDPMPVSAISLSEEPAAADAHVFAPVKYPGEDPINEELVKTRFIAETLLPTKSGKFRLRGYKHSVRRRRSCKHRCMGCDPGCHAHATNPHHHTCSWTGA
jgi:hypothetical protein